MKYIIATLGCKVNQYETQAMEKLLMDHGHSAALPGEQADAIIVNTCAVTAESGRKSRQLIRRLKEESPEAVLAVCGCYSQIAKDEVESLGASVIFGAADRAATVAAVEKAFEGRGGTVNIDEPFQRRQIERLPAGAVSGRTRAMLKIQDGCVNFCSYCIIPYTRGRLRSLPPEEAAQQARQLQEEGYKEIVLTGIEVASYGLDLPGKPSLGHVIDAVAQAAPELRLRLGSLEPTVVTEEFCSQLARSGRLCPHFHLSLQSGCDRTLKAMNRKYDTARFMESVELLRRWFPGCALTGDLIAGFPGETEDDHKDTLAFIRKAGFAALHVFPYSRRPGTPADKLLGQCSKAVKARRAHEAQALADELGMDFLRQQLGSTLPVLFETEEGDMSSGHSHTYLHVTVQGSGLRGKLEDVVIDRVEGQTLFGHLAH